MKLSETAEITLQKRYYLKDKDGNIIEDWEGLCRRVAKAVAEAEKPEERKEWEDKFFDMMHNLYFLPNSPTLVNAGKNSGTLSACFLKVVPDSMEGILAANTMGGMVQKYGGGMGYALSRIRPKGDPISTTHGRALGPLGVLGILSATTEAITQGGFRQGACMGILHSSHPDILDFIKCKNPEGKLSNFNLSVAITDDLMHAVEEDKEWELYFPIYDNPKMEKRVYKKIKARELFDLICHHAWSNGEPGVFFIDEANRWNPTPELGDYEGTNVCGEVVLLDMEACVLGSINLSRLIIYMDGEARVDYDKLGFLIPITIRFLDNIIDISDFPLDEVGKKVRKTRKIGLGVMGWADMLYQLGVPYNSDRAVELAEFIMKYINDLAKNTSQALALEKGSFPAWDKSIYKETNTPMRNAIRSAIAPTGTLSIIADTSGGIEPNFLLEYDKLVLDGEQLHIVNPYYEEAKKSGWLREDYSLKQVFVTAKDISPEWHVKMQAAFQKYVDNSISKCIAKGTLIATNKGVLPIELLGVAKPLEFGEAIPDLKVIDHKGAEKPVLSFYSGGLQPSVRIRFNNGFALECTRNHKLLTIDGWKNASDITKNDRLICRKNKINGTRGGLQLCNVHNFKSNANKLIHPTTMSEDLALWLGMMAADGHLQEETGGVSLSEKDASIGRIFKKITKRLFNINTKDTIDSRTKVEYHTITSRELVRWVAELIGYRSYDKKIPLELLCGSRKEQIAFLRGLSLDGYAKKGNLVVYEGRSKKLAEQVFAICQNLGFNPYLGSKNVKGYDYFVYGISIDHGIVPLEPHKRITQWRRRPRLVPTPPAVYSIALKCKDLGYTNLRYIKRVRPKVVWDYVLDNLGVYFNRQIYVIKPTSINYSSTEVFDIEVQDSHSYVISSLVSHNTINMLYGATVEDVKNAIILAWKLKCKGLTVYRDGSREKQVMVDKKPEDAARAIDIIPGDELEETKLDEEFISSMAPRPRIVESKTWCINTGCGHLYVNIGRVGNDIFELFTHMGKCIAGDTLISSNYGIIPIRDLIRKHSARNPLLVQTSGKPLPIDSTYRKNKDKLYRITLKNGLFLDCSKDHKLLILDEDGLFSYKSIAEGLSVGAQSVFRPSTISRAEYLPIFWSYRPSYSRVGDSIRMKNRRKELRLPRVLDEKLASLLAILVAEGDVCGRTEKGRIRISQVFPGSGQYIASILENYGISVRPGNSKDKEAIATAHLPFREFLAYLGLTYTDSASKEIPWSVLQSPVSVQKAFLSYFFEGEGSIGANGIELTVASKKLISQTQILLLSCGVVSSVIKKQVRGYPQEYYRLIISNYEMAERFQRSVNFISQRKKAALHGFLDQRRKNSSRPKNTNLSFVAPILLKELRGKADLSRFASLYDNSRVSRNLTRDAIRLIGSSTDTFNILYLLGNDLYLSPIALIEYLKTGPVYDLTVPALNNYVANGIVVHNSGGCLQAMLQGSARLISSALRNGVEPEELIDQLRGIRCPRVGWDSGKTVLSCIDALSIILSEAMGIRPPDPVIKGSGNCPGCKTGDLIYQEGCVRCSACSYTECG